MSEYLFEEMGPSFELAEPPFSGRKLFVSFSGGQTSGLMAYLVHKQFGETHEIVTTFANTGQEHEETLRFVHECDQYFGWNVVWIEAEVHHGKRKGCTHRITDYYNAKRKGEPFEEVIKKYGLPNNGYFHCTRELKINPMHSYLKSLWKPDLYTTCIGIRADEMDRMNRKRKELRFWYPLVNSGWTRKHVDDWWDQQPFKLGIENYMGNCVWCYKKSFKKLKRIAIESPQWFEFPKRMEELHKNSGAGGERKIFRNHTTTLELLANAESEDEADSIAGSCEQGCEVFGEYYDPKQLEGTE